MIIPSIVSTKYSYINPHIIAAGKIAKDIIESYCECMGYAYIQRHKKIESLYEKMETGRISSWESIDDLFACSVIIPDLSKEQEVIDYIRTQFDVVNERLRGKTRKDPLVFRFDSTRIVCKIKAIEGISNDEIRKILFEIQIRSAFEHAWAVATHDYTYKSTTAGWIEQRIAAQIKASVEQLDQIILSKESISKHVTEQQWPENFSKQLIIESFTKYFTEEKIENEVKPHNWGVFAANVIELIKHTKGPRPIDEHTKSILLQILPIIDKRIIDGYPRSITLFQYIFGLIVESKIYLDDESKYTPIITEETKEYFPCLRFIKHSMEI